MSAKKKDEKRAELEVVFRTDSTHTNQVILDLCITNHDNFIQVHLQLTIIRIRFIATRGPFNRVATDERSSKRRK